MKSYINIKLSKINTGRTYPGHNKSGKNILSKLVEVKLLYLNIQVLYCLTLTFHTIINRGSIRSGVVSCNQRMSGIGVGIVCMSRSHLQFYVCPYNINYVWNMGFLLFLFIGIQIITGIVLSWHYCSDIQVSYYSIQYLGREVYYGWCLYYIHSSGASFIFGSLIFHVGRGLYVSSNLF